MSVGLAGESNFNLEVEIISVDTFPMAEPRTCGRIVHTLPQKQLPVCDAILIGWICDYMSF